MTAHLSVQQVAYLSRQPKHAVYNAIRSGRLPCARDIGPHGKVIRARVHREDAEAWTEWIRQGRPRHDRPKPKPEDQPEGMELLTARGVALFRGCKIRTVLNAIDNYSLPAGRTWGATNDGKLRVLSWHVRLEDALCWVVPFQGPKPKPEVKEPVVRRERPIPAVLAKYADEPVPRKTARRVFK